MFTIPSDSPWIVIIAGTVLAILAVFIGYRWWVPAQAGWQRLALAGVRALALTLVALLILPLMCVQQVANSPAPRLVILVDASPAMHRGAAGNTAWDIAFTRAFDDELWRKALPAWHIERWAFGSVPQVINSSSPALELEGRDLHRALEVLSGRPRPPDAVVVLNPGWEMAG